MGSRWNKIKEAVSTSISVAESLRKMCLDPRGANYRKFKKIVNKNAIDTSHFKGQSHGTSSIKRKVSWDVVLIKNSEYEINNTRKSRLIKESILNKCYVCNIDAWQGKSIVLQIDHINGNHYDNRIENLRLLCPNCHSQTDTYCPILAVELQAHFICLKRGVNPAKLMVNKNKDAWPLGLVP